MLKVGHVVVLLYRNVEGWSCSSVDFVVRNVEGWSCSSLAVRNVEGFVM